MTDSVSTAPLSAPVSSPAAAPTDPIAAAMAAVEASANPGSPSASDTSLGAPAPKDESAKTEGEPQSESERARFVALAKAQRKAERLRKEAEEKLKAAALERETATKTRQEWDEIVSKAKVDPEAAKKLLEKAGLSFNDLTRLMIGLEPETPSLETKLQELEAKLAAKEQAEREAREAAEKEARERAVTSARQNDLNNIKVFCESRPDDFELIAQNNAYEEVLDRAYRFYAANQQQLGELSTDEQAQLVEFFAREVEDEILESAKSAYARLTKSQKLAKLGIISNSINRVDDTKEQDALRDILGEPAAATRTTAKVISNEFTSAPSPVQPPATSHSSSYVKSWRQKQEEELADLLKTLK